MPMPEIVAHRGYPRHYPENTRIGIEAAIAAGARYIEVDVQLTRDRVPVLFHDRELVRLCGVAGAVADHDFDQLLHYSASDYGRFGYRFVRTPIMALKEMRDLLGDNPGVTAFIELKRISIEAFGANAVLSAVQSALGPAIAQCVVISYALDILHAARSDWPAVGAVIDRWRDRNQDILRDLRPDYLFVDVQGLPLFGRLRHDTAKIVVFEITDPDRAVKLATRGAAMIETFAVGEMRQELLLRGAQS